ncbi:MAG: site-2 protease family protein [Streptosporangiaceae bacterium]
MAGTAPESGPRQAQQTAPDSSAGPARDPRRDRRLGLMIGRPFGVPVYVSPYWFLVAIVLVYLYANTLDSSVASERSRYLVAAAFVVLLYTSVLVHELSHCAVARAFRLPVRRVLLYPLGGFSEIEKEPPAAGQEFLVAAAGPAMSLALAAAALGLTRVIPGGLPNLLIDQLFRANVLVAVFNLLPGLPLDGGRIFRSGIWKLTGKPAVATMTAAWAGRVLAVLMIVGPLAALRGSPSALLSDPYWFWLAFIGVFMWMQSSQAIRSAKVRERLPALQARSLARRAIPIPWNLPLAEAIRRADAAQARALVVVDHASKPIAIVNETAVIATPEQRRPWIEAGSLARTIEDGMVLAADLSGMALVEAVQHVPASEYLLVEPSGQVYGVLAAADLDQAFASTGRR